MSRRIAVLAASLVLLSGTGWAADPKPIETFKTFAASLGTGKTSVLTITINRGPPEGDGEILLTTPEESGRDKLVDALQKTRPPVGYMRLPKKLGYALYYPRNTPTPDGPRRIVMATNR